MNYTTAVFLINSAVRAVSCVYEAEDTAKRTMFKTLDKTIRAGDLVVVPTDTRHKMTVCKVVETDIEVDFDSATCCHWIVAKVDAEPYQKTLAQEADAVVLIKSAEKTKKRNELREAMLADVAELKALPIAGMVDASPAAAE